jgi:hypothetical protein
MIWFLRHNFTEVFKFVELCSKRDGSCGTIIWFLKPNTAESIVSLHETHGSCRTIIGFLTANNTEFIA